MGCARPASQVGLEGGLSHYLPHLARKERRAGSTIAREERLQRAAFLELRDRHAATQNLLAQIRLLREAQAEMVKAAQTQQARQQRQLEELGTQLWNAYRLVDRVS